MEGNNMEHLDFVIWLIGWAFFIHRIIFQGHNKEQMPSFFAQLTFTVGVILWVGIAAAIW